MTEHEPVYGQYEIPEVDQCVNFKIGQPAPDMLPLELIRKAAAEKFAETDPLFLQYGNIYGFPKFRESLSKFLTKHYGFEVSTKNLLATNGNTGALSLILSLFCHSGDLVFAEEPTYFLAKRIFDDYKLNCKQIPMDEKGVIVDLVEKELNELEKQNKPKPVLMYLVTTAHNPTGRTLIAERREKLVQVAKRHGILLVCDEVYQLLTFPGIKPPPAMSKYDNEGNTVVAMGSFSKILCPGLRVGWIQSGPAILKKIADCGQLDSSGGINPVAYGIAQKCIDLGLLDNHLQEVKQKLKDRYDSLASELDKHLPENCGYEVPEGGYFVLVKLPGGQDASELLKIALKNRVAFLPGGGFAQDMKNYLRLSFSMYSPKDIAVGVERLCESIGQYQKSL